MSASAQKRPTKRKDPPIPFTNEDYEGTIPHSDDPMVIFVIIVDYRVEQVLVDQGSSTNVLFWPAFKKLGFSKSSLEECLRTLIDFVGVIHVDQRIARRCYDESTWVLEGKCGTHIMPDEQTRMHLLELDPRFDREDARPQPDEDLKEI
ncbi:hypothetical protein CR513_30481, partial [Mucuna pruriens]